MKGTGTHLADLLRRYGNSSFTVLVGSGDSVESFSLHQQRACQKSGFFEAAFGNEWKEKEEKLIRLPDYEPEHFHIFFLWLYGSKIYSSQDGDIGADENESVTGGDETDREWERLAYAWTIGAYLQCPEFKNAIVDAIIDKSTWAKKPLEQDMHAIVYPKSEDNAPIRKLIVDIAASYSSAYTISCLKNDPAWSDFFRDLSIVLLLGREKGWPSAPHQITAPCKYNEHGDCDDDLLQRKAKGRASAGTPLVGPRMS